MNKEDARVKAIEEKYPGFFAERFELNDDFQA